MIQLLLLLLPQVQLYRVSLKLTPLVLVELMELQQVQVLEALGQLLLIGLQQRERL